MEKNKIIKIVLIVCIIVVLIDQTTKVLANKFMSDSIVKNTGMAFGFNDGNVKNIILTIFVLGILISFLKNQKNEIDTKTTIAVSLAIGGGFSNLLDRIFRGGVVDFIGIWKIPKFNIADCCICMAWGLLIVFLIIYSNKKDVIKSMEELKNKNKEDNK